MKYVCVFAHQDDEMRCLGTLLRLREAGHEIAFVTVTKGDKGLPYVLEADAVGVRDEEMRSVAAAFDAEYVCLGREDGYTYDDPGLRRDLLAAIRSTRADVLITHWTTDYNADHVVTAKAVTDAALFANLASFPTDPTTAFATAASAEIAMDAAPLGAVPRIWYVDPGAGYGFEATHFVELSPGHASRKAELIRYHRSQMDVIRQLSGTDYADQLADLDRLTGNRLMAGPTEAFRPCLAERRIPWPSDLPGRL
ncbi:PIG-L family deacetylase [Kribbella sp. NBC_01245]|uniref:PIG-L deacetylase family protein n=1 Tax=Kribbella sp. NBC_01245 TaxID=2903578 RepID=UPI002E2B7A2F|nr:PIG-L family deacetylase [Kribbella sp. NBC_01245]